MELDGQIREKRSQLRDAFAAYRKAREALAEAQRRLPETSDRAGEIQRLEAGERSTAARFQTISDELAALHRRKFGEWRCRWGGPLPGGW